MTYENIGRLNIGDALIRSAGVYKMHQPKNGDLPAKFYIIFECEPHVQRELGEFNVKPKLKDDQIRFYTNSAFAPKITVKSGKYDDLMEAFKIANVRNINRDSLMRDIHAGIVVDVIDVNAPYFLGTILQVQEILLDDNAVDKILEKAKA